MSCGFRPNPTESEPCGSKSTSSTRRPYSASAAPRLIVVVVLPTPPFWLHIATTRAGPCEDRGAGSGITGIGRPVGPSAPPGASKGRVSDTRSSLPGNVDTPTCGPASGEVMTGADSTTTRGGETPRQGTVPV